MKSHEKVLQDWLPTSKKEMEALGWERADVILFTGDAYIDHPSFGAAVIARVLGGCRPARGGGAAAQLA